MNGFMRKAALGTCLSAAIAVLAGCVPEYRELVDPCWPERYNHQARHSVREAFNAQAANGHELDQTIWAEYFDVKNNSELSYLGRERLKYIALRRPTPDPRVYVQKTCDQALDQKRKEAVENYLAELMACRNMADFKFNVETRLTSTIGLTPSLAAPKMFVKTEDRVLQESKEKAAASSGVQPTTTKYEAK